MPALLVCAAPALAQTEDKPTEQEPVQPTSIGSGTIEVTKTRLSVDGESVEAAPRAVEVSLTLTFHNGSSETLRSVKVTLAESRGVKLTDAVAAIGDLDADKSADGEFAFVLESADCFEFVGLGGEAVHEGGAVPLKVALPAACPGPRLGLGEVAFDGGDGDGVPEPGETLRVSFELFNQGKDRATGVRAAVKVSGEGLSAAGTDLEWPDIEPGGSARNTAPLILSISKDAEREEGCAPGPGPEPGNAADDASLPPDTVMSSNGSVASPDVVRGEPGGVPGSEPAGGGDPSSGSQIEPSQGSGGGATTEEPPDATILPAPLPATVEPEPAGDGPVQMQALLTVRAADYETALEWANKTFCMLEAGRDADAAPATSRRDITRSDHGGAAIPVTLALGISALAAAVHRKFVG